jgi:hypothetical protein
VARVVVRLEDIEAAREDSLYGGSASDREATRRSTEALMRAERLGATSVGARPVGNKRTGVRAETLNQGIISRSPGSNIPPVDFVKAVYADRTGQE